MLLLCSSSEGFISSLVPGVNNVVSSACAWPVLNRGAAWVIAEIRFSCDQRVHGHCDARESVGSVKLRREMCQN